MRTTMLNAPILGRIGFRLLDSRLTRHIRWRIAWRGMDLPLSTFGSRTALDDDVGHIRCVVLVVAIKDVGLRLVLIGGLAVGRSLNAFDSISVSFEAVETFAAKART